MPKRKRDTSPAVRGDGKPRPSLQSQRAENQLALGREALDKALKAARGSERQKLGRRRKTAKGDAKNEARIDAEIEALKTLDLAAVASNYLANRLLKIKAVAASPHLPASLTRSPGQTTDAPSLNVIARLCSSEFVRKVVPQILKDVESALGVQSGDPASRGQKAKSSDPASKRTGQPGVSDDTSDAADSQRRGPNNLDSDEDEFAGFSSDQDVLDEADVPSDLDDDEALAAYNDRLGSSSDESDNDDRPNIDATRALLSSYGPASDSDSDSDPDADPPERSKGLSKPRQVRSATPTPSEEPSPPPARPTTSAFLPSLTSGYISGGSDSDPEAEFDDLLGTGKGEQKKNRRGQRARRLIWEQKYGKGAKHVVAEAEGGKGRDQGWDARRGATDGRGGWRGRGGGGRGGRGGHGATGANSESVKVKHRDDEGKLHPSWEAAKKRKDAAAKGEAPVKFAGKKISFD
ncbi:Bud-site selection protein [Myriangium duriaei CBS 260.36]|uniref:Bud-site selection protein n=1 Tax=Myriangium duriaei CBS 260.36 TaxID=1168546 RepID=A0A9P4MDM7_9PEZI|nr:Bud-site selection protein [Myriangium duriaei CBS 260.36]